jgi:hypothetical protein
LRATQFNVIDLGFIDEAVGTFINVGFFGDKTLTVVE